MVKVTTRPTGATGLGPPLRAVRLAAFKRARAELELAAAIGDARAEGIPWEALGTAIGTSGDVVRLHYSGQQAILPYVSFLRGIAEDALADAYSSAANAPENRRL